MRTRPLWTGVCTDTDTLETSLALSNQADDVDFVLEGNPLISVSVHFSSVQFSRSVMSNSVQPHRRQPTRLHHPWDSPSVSRLVITFLPRSKHLLISWLQSPFAVILEQSPFAVILEPPKIKSDTVPTVSPSICYGVMGPDAMIFVF